MTLEEIGYNSFFETGRTQLGLEGFPVARVIAEHKGAYTVRTENGELLARVTGKHMFMAGSREDFPAIGDWVAVDLLGGGQAVIRAVLPRQTIIKRKHGDKNRRGEKEKVQVIAANIDVAFIVESVDRDYNLNRFERYLSILEDSGVLPAIVVNKTDLLAPEDLQGKLTQLKERFPGVELVVTSTVDNAGLDELKKFLVPGKTYCFLGSSGVGKSSLINALLGESLIKTGDIGLASGRGKHTTTSRQMYFLPGGAIVIDNPGMREVGMAEATRGVEMVFDDISTLAGQCKYSDCTHTHEPGCAVLEAVKSGIIDEEKYSNYTNLKKETRFYELDDVGKRERDRKFGKLIKGMKKDLKNFGHKDY